MMPTDSQGFITEWKGQQIDGVCSSCAFARLLTWRPCCVGLGLVEQVKDGSTLRIRLIMPDGDHQFVNIALAGVRCSRVAGKPGEATEQWGDEVCLCSYSPSLFAEM